MWKRRIAAAAGLAILATMAANPTPGQAAGPGDSITGDFNVDGLPDIVVLGSVEPDLCSVVVRYGSSPGVYLPPMATVYARPGDSRGTSCPDIGVGFDADTDPGDELWIGWSAGPPPSLSYNRLVIDDNLRTILTFSSPITPTFLGTADFSGTGRHTAFSVGHGGFATYIIENGVGRLGPEQWCSTDPPGYQLRDFDRNRATDAVLSYTRGCDNGGNGVVAVLDDGTIHHLETDLTGRYTWTARVLDTSGDRFPDVRTVNQVTGETNYFIGRGDGGFVKGPDANTDTVYLTTVKPLAIDVLANDYVAAETEVMITVPPRYGTARVLSDRRILYTPREHHGRTDSLSYQLRRQGKRSTAAVNIKFPD
ncbi:hypothetical protein I0C86_31555 [Plantactinospora sp. S1510]|uniref:VCBS repeat-containing protein n=1 Tax=Plantactinospora alkalitolerans TaxID=2789879 RepID=A0ABS0H4S7_9ACTN|nr:Ig-like domain-containing protein [Plantactinospora alkalitolerans]MBF9133462.1 hypothetical protein [Plantactinospora alkalitolerans]